VKNKIGDVLYLEEVKGYYGYSAGHYIVIAAYPHQDGDSREGYWNTFSVKLLPFNNGKIDFSSKELHLQQDGEKSNYILEARIDYIPPSESLSESDILRQRADYLESKG
jgi:hypothetical protein